MRLLPFILFLVVWNINAATYYIDYATGSDANNGTAKATPWKRAPGMAGAAMSYSYTSGDRFIFKGGITWPAACYQWKITTDRCYYGVDTSWYSGGSFSRPVFDFENTVLGYWTAGAGFLLEGADYNTIDNLDFKRHRTPLAAPGLSTWGTATITFSSATENVVTNCLVRDWDQPAMTSGNSGGGGIIRINVGDNRIKNCILHQDNVVQKSGTAMWNMAEIGYCEVRNTPTAVMYSGWSIEGIHHNWIHDLPTPADPAAHSNAILALGGMRIHDNLITDTSPTAQIIFINPGYYGVGAAYVYNNTVYRVTQPCVAIDTDGQNAVGSMTYLWNNTFEAPYTGGGLCIYSGIRNNGAIPGVTLQNNHFICNGNPVSFLPAITTLVANNNLTNTYAVATGLGYTQANSYAPVDGTKPTVNTGVNLSTFFTTDRLGVTRSIPWDIGSYEWGTAPSGAGTLVFSSSGGTVSEDAGSITISVYRTGGSSGAIGCSYHTDDVTAVDSVNYTAASGTLSWANGETTTKTFTVYVLDADVYGSRAFDCVIDTPTGGATIGTPSTQSITITGTGTGSGSYLPGWTWNAVDGNITLPFASDGTSVYQSIQTLVVADGGALRFTFTNSAGIYRVKVNVDTPSTASDSFFVSMNTEPTTPSDIWDVSSVTSGFEDRYVGLRGSGAWDAPEFPVAEFSLDTGTNTLIFRGRESNAKIKIVTLEKIGTFELPATIVSVDATNGYYKADQMFPITVTMSTNVTVTGFPSIELSSGGSAIYTGGSGTATLTFYCTVAAGENSQDLDYASTNALELNGATITNGGIDADLTLPEPGTVGSISDDRTVIVDTTAPVITFGEPSYLLVTNNVNVNIALTFTDDNFDRSLVLTADDLTLTATGTAGATIYVSPAVGTSQEISLRNIYGIGSLQVSSKDQKAVDLAGNLAATASSEVITVEILTGQRVLIINTFRARRIYITQ